MRVELAAVLFPFLIAPLPMQAQNVSTSARTTELAALFSKNKHVEKVRHGVRREKFKDVRSEPALRLNPASYSGTYDAGFGFILRLNVRVDGRVEGSGQEPIGETNVSRSFVLRDTRIDGALLVGTIAYSDGHREKLEGAFIDRTTRESASDRGLTVFGLGVVTEPKQVGALTIQRLFYAREF